MPTRAGIFSASQHGRRWIGVALTALVCAGVALRWWRLDLMPFRYDAAEALFRARETFILGHPPLTGIVNSLGFRNPAGLQWIILPAVLLSPDPRVSAAWIGLLVAAGVFPLFWLGRRLGGTAVGWATAFLYAFHPQTIFSSRDVWAQHLLIPLGAWALMFAAKACFCCERRSLQPTAQESEDVLHSPLTCLVAAVALAAVASLVHLAAAMWLGALMVWAGWPCWIVRSAGATRRPFVLLLAILGVFVLAVTPSLLDWFSLRTSPPTEKPPHIAKFELLAPEPKAFPGRLGEAYSGIFAPLASLQVLGGIEKDLPPTYFCAGRLTDLALLSFALLGLARLLLACTRSPSGASQEEFPPALAWLLSAWILLPPAFVGLLMRYPNATYLYFALGAVFLCAVLGAQWLFVGARRVVSAALSAPPNVPAERRGPEYVITGLFFALAVFHVLFFVEAMNTVERVRVADGPYYTPLKEQLGLVREFDRAGIGRNHLLHLGGPWFQRSYDYLLHEVLRVPARSSAVVMEDIRLRRSHPLRQDFVVRNLDREWGTIHWGLFATWDDAKRMADVFYHLPLR